MSKILVEDGRVTTVDEDEVIDRITHYTDHFVGLAQNWEKQHAIGMSGLESDLTY